MRTEKSPGAFKRKSSEIEMEALLNCNQQPDDRIKIKTLIDHSEYSTSLKNKLFCPHSARLELNVNREDTKRIQVTINEIQMRSIT